MKIKLMDKTLYSVERAEITDGRLEIDLKNKTAEEVQEIFSVPGNLKNIELFTDANDKFGDLPDWTVYGGVMLNGEIKTVILTKQINVTEKRLENAEANALLANAKAEEQELNIQKIEREVAESSKNNEVVNASIVVARANAQNLNDQDALKVKILFDEWEDLVKRGFVAEKDEFKFMHLGVLYKTVNAGQIFKENWVPGKGTESIFVKIDETHAGTKEDPIPAAANMEYEKGKYYLEDEKLYLMNRTGMADGEKIVLQFMPSTLVGQYFEEVIM